MVDRNSLLLMVAVLTAVVVVAIVQAVIVINLAADPSCEGGGLAPPAESAGGAPGLWDQYVKPSVGAIGAVAVALITGALAYSRLTRQLRSGTRNAFLDMLVGQSAYRNELDSFLRGIVEGDLKVVRKGIASEALFYLFVLKPGLRAEFERAIDEKDMCRVAELTRELFTA